MVSTYVLMKLLRVLELQRWRVLLFALSLSFLGFAYYDIDVVAVILILRLCVSGSDRN